MFKNKKYIIFDLDGTLIDSVGIWNEVDRRFIKMLGGDASTIDVNKQRDEKMREYKSAEDPYKEYCRFIGEKYNSSLSPSELLALRYKIAHELTANEVDYKPDADSLLYKLHEMGYTLIIASTTRRKNYEVYITENKNIISKAPLNIIFSAVYTRDDVDEIKPSPEVHKRILSDFGASAEECLIFEDSLVGIEAANNAKIDVVAIYDVHSQSDTEKIKALSKAYFTNFKEILNLLY